VREFAARECGTRQQRYALTDGGREPHNAELYAKVAQRHTEVVLLAHLRKPQSGSEGHNAVMIAPTLGSTPCVGPLRPVPTLEVTWPESRALNHHAGKDPA
jgi:hypothetical protein